MAQMFGELAMQDPAAFNFLPIQGPAYPQVAAADLRNPFLDRDLTGLFDITELLSSSDEYGDDPDPDGDDVLDAGQMMFPARSAPIELPRSVNLAGVIPDGGNPDPNKELFVKSVQEVFPDIDPEYVLQLWHGDDPAMNHRHFSDREHAILDHIASEPSYPTLRGRLKGKATATTHNNKAELKLPVSGPLPWEYEHCALYLLQQEFPEFDVKYIKSTLKSGTNRIADAFHKLSKKKAEGLITPPRKKRRIEHKLLKQETVGDWIELATKELEDARNAPAKKQADAAQIEAERLNEEHAQRTGQIVECGCCFSDVPRNRTIHCTSGTSHRFCYSCATTLVDTEVGSRKCRPQCMDMSSCTATFAESQLRLCLPEKTLDHLLRLQQQEDIKAAGIEGLEECPFCDYMMICPSKDEDREFRCDNPDCGKVSCRLCSRDTHLPKTCTEAAADNKLDARHVVEEACSEALIRSCNKCKTKFIKLDGCNKMTCSKCGNHQCYLCSKSITGYEHFGERAKGKCPQNDNDTEALHQAEVKKAEAEARARVQAEMKDVTTEDLAIKVSDRVKADEGRRRGRFGLEGLEDADALLNAMAARMDVQHRLGPGRMLGGVGADPNPVRHAPPPHMPPFPVHHPAAHAMYAHQPPAAEFDRGFAIQPFPAYPGLPYIGGPYHGLPLGAAWQPPPPPPPLTPALPPRDPRPRDPRPHRPDPNADPHVRPRAQFENHLQSFHGRGPPPTAEQRRETIEGPTTSSLPQDPRKKRRQDSQAQQEPLFPLIPRDRTRYAENAIPPHGPRPADFPPCAPRPHASPDEHLRHRRHRPNFAIIDLLDEPTRFPPRHYLDGLPGKGNRAGQRLPGTGAGQRPALTFNTDLDGGPPPPRIQTPSRDPEGVPWWAREDIDDDDDDDVVITGVRKRKVEVIELGDTDNEL